MKDKTKRALQDLVEKASKLKRYDLIGHMQNIGFGFRANVIEDGSWEIEFDQPDEKDLDASLLTFRLFLQKGEPFSFYKFDYLSQDTSLSKSFRAEITKAQTGFLEYIYGYPLDIEPNFFNEGEYPTREEILNVVLNGNLSHTKNYQLRRKYETWSRDGIRRNVLHQVFTRTVLHVMALIISVAEKAESELNL